MFHSKNKNTQEHKLLRNKQAAVWQSNALEVRQNREKDKTKLTEGSLTPFRIVLSGLQELQILTR